MWINSNGSGRARVQVEMPTLLFKKLPNWETLSQNVVTATSESDGITLDEISVSTESGRTQLAGAIAFDDARSIEPFIENLLREQGLLMEGQAMPPKSVTVATRFPDLSFRRVLDFRSLTEQEKIPPFALGLLGEEASMRFVMHLPTPAKVHNASKVSADNRTLEWAFPITTLLSEESEMTFTAPLPFIGTALTIFGILLLLLTGLVVRLIRRRKRLNSSKITSSASS